MSYTPDQIQEWVRRYQAGESFRQIGEATDTPYPTVAWYIRRSDVFAPRKDGRKKKYVGRSKDQVHRNCQLRRDYGITLDDYEVMLKSQDGVCAICGDPPKGGKTSSKNLHVDHDHETGKVRGLLCNNCNLGVGKFRDDPLLMEKAASYMRQHG